jgi:hypothetical protein
MNDKSSFVKVVKVQSVITKQFVITKQLKLCFINSSRIPTQLNFLDTALKHFPFYPYVVLFCYI